MNVIAGEENKVCLRGDRDLDLFELEKPNGESEYVEVEINDPYITARSGRDGPLYIFESGQLRTKLERKVWNALPLERGYVVITYGVHQDLIFAIYLLEDGKMVLQRKVDVARGLEATPDERYVATWRLTDTTVYIYDVVEASEAGRFCTTGTGAENVNLYGKTQDGKPGFEIEDNTTETTVGYVTVDGTFTSV